MASSLVAHQTYSEGVDMVSSSARGHSTTHPRRRGLVHRRRSTESQVRTAKGDPLVHTRVETHEVDVLRDEQPIDCCHRPLDWRGGSPRNGAGGGVDRAQKGREHAFQAGSRPVHACAERVERVEGTA
jgi:hypothetical protein